MTYIKMAVKQDNKVQKVCFTLNNYTPEEYNKILECGRNKCSFMVVGKETGENGTPHLQGYANFSARTRFTALKKFLPRAHFEKAAGTDEQNLTYCTKQDKQAFIWGEPQHSGKRNDLSRATAMIKEKKRLSEVASACPEIYVKYGRGLRELNTILQTPRDRNDPPTVLWLWGRTGVGKTRLVYDQFPTEEIYKKDNTLWWDGYEGQNCILIDDFTNRWDYDYVLQLTDRYPFRVQIKGGYVQINSPFIIFTCEYPPQYYWSGTVLEQIARRITMVQEML